MPVSTLPIGYPSATLAPGESRWLPADPSFPDLEPCDAPVPDAAVADTTGSEQ